MFGPFSLRANFIFQLHSEKEELLPLLYTLGVKRNDPPPILHLFRFWNSKKFTKHKSIIFIFLSAGTPHSSRFGSTPKMEENGMIHHYLLHSGVGGLLLRNDKRSLDKLLRFLNSFIPISEFRKVSETYIIIFLHFWRDGTPKSEFRTRETVAHCFGNIFFCWGSDVR